MEAPEGGLIISFHKIWVFFFIYFFPSLLVAIFNSGVHDLTNKNNPAHICLLYKGTDVYSFIEEIQYNHSVFLTLIFDMFFDFEVLLSLTKQS